ncbi:2,3-dihydro-2,3-dihydroxybenzoate dehydrogenase [Aeromonas media]|uniref:2,3-dihydro-2,3-dihydroxybenzoate dehydrogenase n=1 Tax=Aeromonas media TaxID=651 RepID=UPI00196B29FD|nr:2,3-dihydro-2,3-dihydroxybenzoate dehydrogenase [Aeromonas media]QSE73350.1 2,3-dihydro-2,3-dihydroxybenzoate dehydrogenase [Aeromonas media]
MAFDFTGKRVWVTGAGRGIGREVATQFVAAGAIVVGLDLAFPEADYPYATRLLDIGDSKAVNACCAALLADGGLDVLVNGAGVLRLGPTDALSDDDWHDCMTVNASGVFYLLRALVPHFKGQQRGAIVTIGSNAAHVPRMQMAAYCASKAAVTSLTQTVGLELAPFGVRVNLVSPGSTDTEMLRGMLPSEEAMARTIKGLPDQFKLGIPLNKIATPREIANTVLFLASSLASHITLQDLVVDGGATLSA